MTSTPRSEDDMRMPQGAEWLILLVIMLLLFGASRLPGLARSVGRSMKIFRSEVKDLREEEGRPGTSTTTDPDAPADTPTSGTRPDDGRRTT